MIQRHLSCLNLLLNYYYQTMLSLQQNPQLQYMLYLMNFHKHFDFQKINLTQYQIFHHHLQQLKSKCYFILQCVNFIHLLYYLIMLYILCIFLIFILYMMNLYYLLMHLNHYIMLTNFLFQLQHQQQLMLFIQHWKLNQNLLPSFFIQLLIILL